MIIICDNTDYCIDFDAYFSEILEVLEEENQTREELREAERFCGPIRYISAANESEEDNNAAKHNI